MGHQKHNVARKRRRQILKAHRPQHMFLSQVNAFVVIPNIKLNSTVGSKLRLKPFVKPDVINLRHVVVIRSIK